MPQVIIHTSSWVGLGSKAKLVQDIRNTLTTVLKLDPISGQVILYESATANRSTYEERDPNFVVMETFMYPGRSPEKKSELMERFIFLVEKHIGIDRKNIHAVIHEIPKENYFGGMLGRH
jgi:phenylpyruvate tautomerase PptA (4-oxalocrotonate tautomerase family)